MRATTIFHSVLGEGMEKYLAHKRAIGRRFRTEENVLHILDRYFVQEQISSVQQITPELLDAFLLSRPRESSRSYNHLLRARSVDCSIGWSYRDFSVVFR